MITNSNFTKSPLDKFLCLEPLQRRLLLITVDALILPLAVWISFWLRLAHPFHSSFVAAGWWLLPTTLLIGLPLYAFSGQYKGLTRYVGSRSLYQLALRNGLLVLVLIACGAFLRLPMPPRSSWLLLWLLLTGFTGTIRFGLRDLLLSFQSKPRQSLTRVAIYGAGAAGVQLAAALRLANNHSVELFVDDDPDLWGRSINGVSIQPPQLLQHRAGELDQVLLAIPSLAVANAARLSILCRRVVSLCCRSLYGGDHQRACMHRCIKANTGGGSACRDAVPCDPQPLGSSMTGASICVTGAGGSIGSELCRQILALKLGAWYCLIAVNRVSMPFIRS